MVFVMIKRDEEVFWELVGFGCYLMGFDVVRGNQALQKCIRVLLIYLALSFRRTNIFDKYESKGFTGVFTRRSIYVPCVGFCNGGRGEAWEGHKKCWHINRTPRKGSCEAESKYRVIICFQRLKAPESILVFLKTII